MTQPSASTRSNSSPIAAGSNASSGTRTASPEGATVDPDGVLARSLGRLDGDVGILQQIGGGRRRALAKRPMPRLTRTPGAGRRRHAARRAPPPARRAASSLATRSPSPPGRSLSSSANSSLPWRASRSCGPDDRAQAVGDDAQQRVAGLVAPALVDAPEVVEVDGSSASSVSCTRARCIAERSSSCSAERLARPVSAS